MHQEKKEIFIGFRLKPSLAENLRKVSEVKGWTTSKTIRKILEDYLK